MPFGLINAPASFSRLMRIVTKDLPDVFAYMDDILIASKEWNSHIKGIESLLERLRYHGFHAKPSKCMFAYQKLTYLGHLIGEGLYCPLEDKVKAIIDIPLPQDQHQLRSFLGSVGYYQKFIPHFTDITSVLFDRSKKKGTKRFNGQNHLKQHSFNLKNV